jgi:hypothetical protein
MDYGKFKYEQSKKTKQAKKTATTIEIKEIKFRPKTDDHDFDFKVRAIRRFLEEGNKVRLVIAFRGREIVHPETGRAMLDHVIKATMDIAHVEQLPMMDGRRMVMTVSPKMSRTGGPPPPAVHARVGGPPPPAGIPTSGSLTGGPTIGPNGEKIFPRVGPPAPVAPAATAPAAAPTTPATTQPAGPSSNPSTK